MIPRKHRLAKQQPRTFRMASRRGLAHRRSHSPGDADVLENWVGCLVLIDLFNGSPNAWISYLEGQGSQSQRENDLPFAQELNRRAAADPDFLRRIRRAVEEFRRSSDAA